MKQRFNMNDQSTLNFLVSQASHIESEVYKKKYPDVQYQDLIPIDTSANDWAQTVTFFSMDHTGKAKLISGNGDDIPFADVMLNKYESSIQTAATGYRYNIVDVNQAMQLGVNLGAEGAFAARRAYEFMLDDAYLAGGIQGMNSLINYPGITTVAAPNAAAVASPLWATKTAPEVLADVNNLLSGVWIDSLTVETADTLLVPETSFVQIGNKQIPGTSMTLMAYIMANNVYTMKTGRPLTIRTIRQLETAGGGGTRRAVAYRRDMDILKAHIPMPLFFLPMEVRGLDFIFPGIFRFGALDIRRPGSVRYLDGI